MMAMGLPDVKRFPFIEPPETKSLDEALDTLVVSTVKSLVFIISGYTRVFYRIYSS